MAIDTLSPGTITVKKVQGTDYDYMATVTDGSKTKYSITGSAYYYRFEKYIYRVEYTYSNASKSGSTTKKYEDTETSTYDIVGRRHTWTLDTSATACRICFKKIYSRKEIGTSDSYSGEFSTAWSSWKTISYSSLAYSQPTDPSVTVNADHTKATLSITYTRSRQVQTGKAVGYIQFVIYRVPTDQTKKSTYISRYVKIPNGTAGAPVTLTYEATLSSNTRYYFKCRAINNKSSVSYSGPYSDLSDSFYGKMSAPTGLKGQVASSESATLLWTPIKMTEGSYEIEYTLNPNNFYDGSEGAGITKIDNIDGTLSSYLIEGLTGGNTYYFRIRAVSNDTISNWTNHIQLTIGTRPSPPTIWSVPSILIQNDTEDLTLYWTHNSEDNSPLTETRMNFDFGSDKEFTIALRNGEKYRHIVTKDGNKYIETNELLDNSYPDRLLYDSSKNIVTTSVQDSVRQAKPVHRLVLFKETTTEITNADEKTAIQNGGTYPGTWKTDAGRTVKSYVYNSSGSIQAGDTKYCVSWNNKYYRVDKVILDYEAVTYTIDTSKQYKRGTDFALAKDAKNQEPFNGLVDVIPYGDSSYRRIWRTTINGSSVLVIRANPNNQKNYYIIKYTTHPINFVEYPDRFFPEASATYNLSKIINYGERIYIPAEQSGSSPDYIYTEKIGPAYIEEASETGVTIKYIVAMHETEYETTNQNVVYDYYGPNDRFIMYSWDDNGTYKKVIKNEDVYEETDIPITDYIPAGKIDYESDKGNTVYSCQYDGVWHWICEYPLTSFFTWKAKTYGITLNGYTKDDSYSDWSVSQNIKVYSKPLLDVVLFGGIYNPELFEDLESISYTDNYELTRLPLSIILQTSTDDSQKPLNYSINIKANNTYQYEDVYGNITFVGKNESIYNEIIDIVYGNDQNVTVEGNTYTFYSVIDYTKAVLQPDQEYTVECVVGMSSGVTVKNDDDLSFFVNMVGIDDYSIVLDEYMVGENDYSLSLQPTVYTKASVQCPVEQIDYSEIPDEWFVYYETNEIYEGDVSELVYQDVQTLDNIEGYVYQDQAGLYYATIDDVITEDTVFERVFKLLKEDLFVDPNVVYFRRTKPDEDYIVPELNNDLYEIETYVHVDSDIPLLPEEAPDPESLTPIQNGYSYNATLGENLQVYYENIEDEFYFAKKENLENDDYYIIAHTMSNELIYCISNSLDEIMVYDNEGVEAYYTNIEGTDVENELQLSVYRRNYDDTYTEIPFDPDTGLATDLYPSLFEQTYLVSALDPSNGKTISEEFTLEDVVFSDDTDSPKNNIIIQWGSNSENILLLPYNTGFGDSYSQDVTLVDYIGNEDPVSYYGTKIGESSSWTTEFDKRDYETLRKLRVLARYMGDVYVREPSGVGYWANIVPSFNRSYDSLLISVTISVTKVKGGF